MLPVGRCLNPVFSPWGLVRRKLAASRLVPSRPALPNSVTQMRSRSGLFPLALLLSACAAGAPAAPAQPTPAPPEATATPDAQATTASTTGVPAPDSRTADVAPAAPITSAPGAWQLLDLAEDRVPGVSADRAYRELLADRTPGRTVVVAVIDGGIDTLHVDLRASLWENPGETPGNGIDDDENGYVDDVYGWNFIGGADGRNVGHETLEVTRLFAKCERGEALPSDLVCADVESAYEERKTDVDATLVQLDQLEQALAFAIPILEGATAAEELTVEAVQGIRSNSQRVNQARAIYLQLTEAGIDEEVLADARESYEGLATYGLDIGFDPRDIVGDDLENGMERLYGNGDVMGPDASHGTHVSGIIGAERDNGEGLDGLAAGVRVMMIRTIPDGDERDKDVANAIRYAVDNGADIINMSFGKTYSPRKALVDAAIGYADEAGVLMVHAAGNDGENLDDASNFPTPEYDGGGEAENWIEVGAANWSVDSLAATFSNYSQTRVDVFAPGVAILSTVPGSEYKPEDGTSMAAPVVTGVAAMLMTYFPELTAGDVKRILMESAVEYGDRTVPQPGTGTSVPFGTLSVTGGVVNAYQAVLMALERM
jgi:subtilisin family serine protease